ncbi:MAG: formate acetyltransferase, partial [Mycoplasmataceae bacterium]|nr:formate acetyltransferase [Mycoplasmataceae bacterium]
MKYEQWKGFKGYQWKHEVDVREFIMKNYKPYEGDDKFLQGATEATNKLWAQVMQLTKEEIAKGGVWDVDTSVVSSVDSHGPGYLNKELEKIVGVQTEKPFKRAFMPYGGVRMAVKANQAYGYDVDKEIVDVFTKIRKTHNQGVF